MIEAAARVAVLSPHLDDAALSLGALIASWTRTGAAVKVITVLAGDTASSVPAGSWDRLAGFKTAGEAARARAAEDDRACAILGGVSVRLPFSDRQYARGGSEDMIRAAISDTVAESDIVLVPGSPLVHEDHAWVERVVRSADLQHARVGLYAEQPYTLWNRAEATSATESARSWTPMPTTLDDRRTKLESCRAYESQIPLIGGVATVLGVLAYETQRGGEAIAWLTRNSMQQQ